MKIKKIITSLFTMILLVSCASSVTFIPTNTSIPISTLTSTPLPKATITATQTPMSWDVSNFLLQLNNMAVLPNGEVWAIGQNETIIHDRVRIAHLAEVFDYRGNRGYGYLSAIEFIAPDDGWITGFGGQILHWNGKEWSAIVPFGFENPVLKDIGFADKNNGWAVGCYKNIKDQIDFAVLMKWDGSSWNQIILPENISKGYCFREINIISDTNIWISGNNYRNGKTLLLNWDGSQWQEIPVSPKIKSFTAISAINDTDLWALTGNDIEHWNGSNWQQINLPNDHWFFYSENEFATPDILALSNNDVWVGGRSLFHWDGYELQDFNYNSKYGWIVDIEVDANGNVWALTFSGTILNLTKKQN